MSGPALGTTGAAVAPGRVALFVCAGIGIVVAGGFVICVAFVVCASHAVLRQASMIRGACAGEDRASRNIVAVYRMKCRTSLLEWHVAVPGQGATDGEIAMTDEILSKMRAGEWYNCLTDELEAMRNIARDAVHEHSTMPPSKRGASGPRLRRLLARFGSGTFVEAPFHCAYGINIDMAEGVYVNAGCVILDSAPVRIGQRSLLGPGVHIYCADHHRNREKRTQGIERALPVTIGAEVWIGGGSTLLPGVTVGDGAIVGAGSIVTKDVPPETRVAGNPARQISVRPGTT